MSKELEKIISDYEHDRVVRDNIIQALKEKIALKKMLKENEKHCHELLKEPTKENVLTVKKYVEDVCMLFGIPFTDELKIEEAQA